MKPAVAHAPQAFDRATFEATRASEYFIPQELATLTGQPPKVFACAWRIHKITRQSVSGTARDSASASDTRQNLSATQVRQTPASGLLTPRASGAH